MKMSKSFSAALDCLRWVAALEVVGFHLRRMMFVYPVGASAAWKLFFVLTCFGHQAVVVFFVLSGFLVGGSVMNEMRSDRFSWRIYLAKRIARLYPVFVLGLLMGLGFDNLGLHFFNHYQFLDFYGNPGGIYTSVVPLTMGSITTVISRNLGPSVFFSNLVMLQTIVQPPLGSNGPLWSLCNEFWYYILFPLAAALLVRRSIGLGGRLLCILLFLAIAYVVGPQIMIYFLIWLLGVAASVLMPLAPKTTSARLLAIVAPLAVLATLAYCKYEDQTVGGFKPDCILGVSIALLIFAYKGSQNIPIGRPQLHRFLADFSYSLYIIHFPLMVLAMAMLSDHTAFHFLAGPSGAGLIVFVSLVIFSMLAAFGVSLVTERRTALVRDALLQLTASHAEATTAIKSV